MLNMVLVMLGRENWHNPMAALKLLVSLGGRRPSAVRLEL